MSDVEAILTSSALKNPARIPALKALASHSPTLLREYLPDLFVQGKFNSVDEGYISFCMVSLAQFAYQSERPIRSGIIEAITITLSDVTAEYRTSLLWYGLDFLKERSNFRYCDKDTEAEVIERQDAARAGMRDILASLGYRETKEET